MPTPVVSDGTYCFERWGACPHAAHGYCHIWHRGLTDDGHGLRCCAECKREQETNQRAREIAKREAARG